MGEDGYAAGDSTIADLTIAGEESGSTTVSLSDLTVNGTGDALYDVTDVSGAAVIVAEDETPPPVVGEDPPQDLDDAQALFQLYQDQN